LSDILSILIEKINNLFVYIASRLLLIFLYFVVEFFFFFLFCGFVRAEEFSEENVEGSEGEEDREEDAPRNVELYGDKGSDKDEKGHHRIIGTSEEILPEGEGKADDEHDGRPPEISENECGKAKEKKCGREGLGLFARGNGVVLRHG
jgi:hypothetical protein